MSLTWCLVFYPNYELLSVMKKCPNSVHSQDSLRDEDLSLLSIPVFFTLAGLHCFLCSFLICVLFLAMIFHDFPWGARLAPWDVKLSQQDFNLRVSACDRLNTYKDSVSFALCSLWDAGMVKSAYEHSDWKGGSIGLTIKKLGKIEPTKVDYGLINVANHAVVTFKGRQSEATWSFTPDPSDRENVWEVLTEKRKRVDQHGVVNPSEQPLEIDQRAMMHWSRHGEWVFVDSRNTSPRQLRRTRQ